MKKLNKKHKQMIGISVGAITATAAIAIPTVYAIKRQETINEKEIKLLATTAALKAVLENANSTITKLQEAYKNYTLLDTKRLNKIIELQEKIKIEAKKYKEGLRNVGRQLLEQAQIIKKKISIKNYIKYTRTLKG